MARKCNVYTPKGSCMTGDLSSDYAISLTSNDTTQAFNSSFQNRVNYFNNNGEHTGVAGGKIKIFNDPNGNRNGTQVDRKKDSEGYCESLLVPFTFEFNTVTNISNLDNPNITKKQYQGRFNRNIVTEFKELLDNANNLVVDGKKFAVSPSQEGGSPFSIYRYTKVNGGKNLSWHAYGIAIDFSPGHNPCGKGNYCPICKKNVGNDWLHIRTEDHPLVKLFYNNPIGGYKWRWGGIWNEPDYMHFDFGVDE